MLYRVMAAAAAVAFLSTPVAAGDSVVAEATLNAPGETVEVRGSSTRVIAFYREDGQALDVALVMMPEVGNANLLRSGASLVNGASLSLRLSALAAGTAPETVTVRRRGANVHLTLTTDALLSASTAPSAAIAALD